MSAASDALAGPDDPTGPKFLYPKVPNQCMMCGAEWMGGHQVPGLPMKAGLRVFYRCGSSLSVWKDLGNGAYQLLLKNCFGPENAKILEDHRKEVLANGL